MSTRQCYTDIQQDNSPNNWTMARVVEIGKDVEQYAMGFGWDSFVEKFKSAETEILFGAFRTLADDGLGQPRSKIVLVNWIGSRCPPKKRASILTAKQEIANIFNNTSISVDANDVDKLAIKDVAKAILNSTAAHKPLFYEFGDQKVQVADL